MSEKCFADDLNYIDNNGELNEITVTITLGEYRQLIQNQTQAVYELTKKDDEIKQLRDEVKNVCSTRDSYLKIIYAKCPEIAEKILEFGSLVSNIFSGDDTDCDEENKQCEECEHFEKTNTEYPCSHCRNCYTDHFEPKKDGTNETEQSEGADNE